MLSFLYFAVFMPFAHTQHMNAPGNHCEAAGSNASVTQCFISGSEVADHELNDFYSLLKLKLRADDLEQLRGSQRLWIKLRDANCTAERQLYFGGSAAPTVYAACLESETKQRTKDLHLMYDWLLEK
jgi:uncharacterized protein YecT (DUF1311 family)